MKGTKYISFFCYLFNDFEPTFEPLFTSILSNLILECNDGSFFG